MKQNIKIGKRIPNSGAMDFSHLLDAPAGKHGFVKVKNGHFYFEDGTRAKFVGFNFAARANMPDNETADCISERLASLGVNMVRLHAADAMPAPFGWSTNPENPLIDYGTGSSQKFSEKGRERLDYWVARLKEKGIYVQVDLLVGRGFLTGDELDYPEMLYESKSSSHINERLIELQKQYATEYLTHVNPYTGMSFLEDPAVMGIQICNEDSVFFCVDNSRQEPGIHFYRKEMQERFNHYLLFKYHTRANLEKAWTFQGKCALQPDEDPEKGTVRCITIGEYHQPMNEPVGEWSAPESPARYADFTEFGIMINRKYYDQMLEHIRSLGAKVPLTTSCLLAGAADIYSHMDGDFIENNAYFNHPAPTGKKGLLYIPHLREYISTDPRKETYGGFEPRSNLVTQVSGSLVEGKPFVLSEWNEYGEYPFHSSAFMMTAAYACLNDWDGICIYCYHTADSLDSQPEDAIGHIMDAYNDSSLILQFGTMSEVFLKGLVKPSFNKVDVVYNKKDLLTQPEAHRMPYTVLPFLTKVRNVYLEHGIAYQGDAKVAVSAGFLSSGSYENAEHAVVYARSPYRDAFRRSYAGEAYFEPYEQKERKSAGNIALNDKYLVIRDICSLTENGDYTGFADAVDKALKQWGILDADKGIGEHGVMVSDTGELAFCPEKAYFTIESEYCSFFTGKPEGMIQMSRGFQFMCNNDRITLALLPLDGKKIEQSEHLLLTALGKSGMDESEYTMQEDGIHTCLKLKGKLYLETVEGSLRIECGENAELTALDVYGKPIRNLDGTGNEDGSVDFILDGNYMGNFEVRLRKG